MARTESDSGTSTKASASASQKLLAAIHLRALTRVQPRVKREPRVVPLQGGSIGTPIYLMNTGPDEMSLARLMPCGRPVFGIESPWPLEWRRAAASNRRSALPSMEQLADSYFAALRTHAQSPCVLAGHSLAGVIAFEVAHRYQAAGGKVEMVMMFDSATGLPSAFEAARCRWKQIWQDARNASSESLGRRLKDSLPPLRWIVARNPFIVRVRRRINRGFRARTLTTLPDELGKPIEFELLVRLYENAIRTHRPGCLDSRGVLFSASDGDVDSELRRATDRSKGWDGLFSQGLEIVPVGGDHLSMIRNERHHPTLAGAIGRALTTPAQRDSPVSATPSAARSGGERDYRVLVAAGAHVSAVEDVALADPAEGILEHLLRAGLEHAARVHPVEEALRDFLAVMAGV